MAINERSTRRGQIYPRADKVLIVTAAYGSCKKTTTVERRNVITIVCVDASGSHNLHQLMYV
ncbi:MAG: hypothetical protein QOK66_02705 [Nitrososphaeraceae archaeon]|nr:hypothetical protein [Nitrososphaeraceae archaeon]